MNVRSDIVPGSPDGFQLRDVSVRLARPDERTRWDALMERETCKSGKKSTEIAYGITSVPEDRGTPENLLAWNRSHWSVENRNHRVRDVNFREDACLSRTMHAPNNGAICNCIALAIILRRSPNIAEMRRHFALHRHEAIEAVLSPG